MIMYDKELINNFALYLSKFSHKHMYMIYYDLIMYDICTVHFSFTRVHRVYMESEEQ